MMPRYKLDRNLDRDAVAANTRRVIAKYENLNRAYEKQNRCLAFQMRFPMVLLMWPFYWLWRSLIESNEEMIAFNTRRIEANKEWLQFFGYET